MMKTHVLNSYNLGKDTCDFFILQLLFAILSPEFKNPLIRKHYKKGINWG